MTVNLELNWDSLDPHWEVFNKTKLALIPEAPPAKAVISYPLFLLESGKLGTYSPVQTIMVGMVSFTPDGLRDILGVPRLTRTLRESRKTLLTVNKFLTDLQ